jgi:dTDP-4-dehydrorhamnose 3,5-epimerase
MKMTAAPSSHPPARTTRAGRFRVQWASAVSQTPGATLCTEGVPMDIADLRIPDVKIITQKRFYDDRGTVCETYNKRLLADLGIEVEFVQDNQSLSSRAGDRSRPLFPNPAICTRQTHAGLTRENPGCLSGHFAKIRRRSVNT